MARLVLLLVLLPAAALAQTSATEPLVIQVNGASAVTVYPETCSLTLTGKWFTQVTQAACEPMKVWGTSGECGDAPGTSDVRYPDVAVSSLAARAGEFSVKVSALPGFKDTATPCGGDGFELTHRICAAVVVTSGVDCTFTTSRSTVRATPAVLTYDTLAPAAPSLDGVTAFDSAAQVYFTAGDDAVAVEVEVKVATDPDFAVLAEVSASSNSSRLQNLTNDVTYLVRVVAVDAADNRSPPSAELEFTPRLTQGFWAVYQAGGGGDRGCGGASATGFGAPLAWLLLLGLAPRRKR